MNEHILITGAAGFVGRALTTHLVANHRRVTAVARIAPSTFPAAESTFLIASLDRHADLSAALEGVGVVIHCAAVTRAPGTDDLEQRATLHEVNVEGTLTLARQAAKAGVRRLVFLSSIKVNGEESRESNPFRSNDAPAPEDAYGQSKLEAERG
ncbi:MAG TPA: NAD-dependent epimerase/dehydratase family protein, partial [Azoarcus taiwanensis]|nr:NAD-dependent epimerase/dehydratase family protein [Azoarcus taiwanensis]